MEEEEEEEEEEEVGVEEESEGGEIGESALDESKTEETDSK